MLLKLGADTYRKGARERIEESRELLNCGFYAGSVYLAGRAVEGGLRALIWINDENIRLGRKALSTGHDIRQLATQVQCLGVFRFTGQASDLTVQLQSIAHRWVNNMRFVGNEQLDRFWRRTGVIRPKRSSTLKYESRAFYNDCLDALTRFETLWNNYPNKT